MKVKVYKGKVKAKIIDLRFATSGKLAGIFKKKGDLVKKGELVASLDKKLFQLELDRQLKDYEKKRSEFEIFVLKEGEPKDDLVKYLKVGKQAELDLSVKDVEQAKAKMDQLDLFSPVEGIVLNDSELVSGIYLTPASNPIKIIESNSYFLEVRIEQNDLSFFSKEKKVNVSFLGLDKSYSGKTKPIASSLDSIIKVEIELRDFPGIILGLEGKVSF